MKIEAYGYVKEGRLYLMGRKRLDADIKALKDCNVQIVIRKKGKRSLPQNRYYFGVVLTEIRAELLRIGQIMPDVTTEDLHEALKLKFNPVRTVDEGTGEVLLEMGGSTASLNKDEFGIYLDKVIQWCATSLGLHIPEPSTQTSLFTSNQAA